MCDQDTPQGGASALFRPRPGALASHPLRPIRESVDRALAALSTKLRRLYAHTGRPSEKLLRALLLQVLYRTMALMA